MSGRLLTRAIPRSAGQHQVAFYQQLVAALGFPATSAAPSVRVPQDARETAGRLLLADGWDGRMPLVALAPGAAYGGGETLATEYFGELAAALAVDGVAA